MPGALRALGIFAALALSAAPALPADSAVTIVAHRGGLGDYPENTLAAFRHAMACGADGIELDLRATSDGAIVVLHDETVNRTTDGRGRVAAMSLAELRRLDAGQGERIPTLEEVLRLVAGTGVQLVLDLKEEGAVDRGEIVRLAGLHDAAAGVIVGVRSLEDLRAFGALDPQLRTLGFIDDADDIEPFAQAGADMIRLWPDWIDDDPALVGRVRRLGLPVWVTAGDAPREELERLIGLGAAGLILDRPAVINSVRGPSPPARPARSPAAAACT
jgi:glycerophosphoryl diester phosphodiesterase